MCWACPLRSQCIAAKGRKGRQVLIHPKEDPAGGPGVAAERRLRPVPAAPGGGGASTGPTGAVGHPTGPLLQPGQDQVPVYLAATVANLTLLANQTGAVGLPGDDPGRSITTVPIGDYHACVIFRAPID